jgi:hypothetical protein
LEDDDGDDDVEIYQSHLNCFKYFL